MVADAASRHDYTKLANLGLQVSDRKPSIKASTLRQKLNIFFITPLHQQLVALTTPQENPMNPSVGTTITSHSPHPSKRSRTGLPISWLQPNQQQQSTISPLSAPSTSNSPFQPLLSTTLASTSSSEAESGYMAKASKDYDSHSQLQSSSEWSMRSDPMRKGLMSNRRSVWHLPASYDLENLHGILDLNNIMHPISRGNTSPLLQTQ